MWITLDETESALLHGDGAGVKIAVIDSGIEVSHQALAGLTLADDLMFVKSGQQLTIAEGKGIDRYGHGTAIASIIRKVAPAASIGSFQAFNHDLKSTSVVIALAAREAIRRGYNVLSCSFGCSGVKDYIMLHKDWVDEAYINGVHIVSACNNQNVSIKEWPSYFPSVISVNMARVADTSLVLRRAGRMVEFAAQGTDLELPWLGGTIKRGESGSSYAAPVVAALVARLLGRHPNVSPLAAKALLQQIAKPWSREFAADNEF